MINIFIILIITAVLAGCGAYLHKEKKKGSHCIGCPYSKNCGGGCKGKE